jgi:hypothetical protein
VSDDLSPKSANPAKKRRLSSADALTSETGAVTVSFSLPEGDADGHRPVLNKGVPGLRRRWPAIKLKRKEFGLNPEKKLTPDTQETSQRDVALGDEVVDDRHDLAA